MNRQWLIKQLIFNHTAQKIKFSIRGFFSKCDQICSIFCAVPKRESLKEDVEFMKKELNSRDELKNFLIYT